MLNLVVVAEAHVLRKTRLWHHVQGTQLMESVPLRRDDIGQLGSLISGSVLKQFCEPEVYRQLSEAHQQFHQFDALIVESLKAGDRARAAAVLKNEYSLSLRQIIHALSKINRCLE